jgi:hypothetical protein
MSDLRTRIAQVLVHTVSVDYPTWDESLALADAVIRELKLEAEDGECRYCHAMLPGCRYSTWKADDE